jgi:drug/metabolite transporter (DMT)-like permease
MTAVILALGSSVLWGLADFSGGTVSRRLPLAAVTVFSQAAGLAALLVWLAVAGPHLDGRALWLGALGGIGGGIGLAAFYRGLAIGTMSIVSPVAACGAVVPVGLALAGGERPSRLALVGVVLGIGGAVLASFEEQAGRSGAGRQAVLMAVTAAVALGLFVYFLGRAGAHGETLSALLGARAGSLAVLAAGALVLRASLRLSRRALLPVVAIGLVDTGANALFALASSRGLLTVVAVLGSLYPVTTLLLAHVVHGERISPVQRLGVAVALIGIALVSA